KLQLCAQQTTTAVDLILHKLRPAKQLLQYSASSSAAFDAVQSGACQALILDTPIIEAQAAKKPGAYGGVIGQINTHEGYAADCLLSVPGVWTGFKVNLALMLVAEALGLVFALMLAIVRGLPGRGAAPLRWLAIAYTDMFRGTPLILVIYLVLWFATLDYATLS